MRKAILLSLTALAFAGCVSVGRPFRQGPALPTIEPGKTTKKEIQKIFGDPTRSGTEEGDETWTYIDYKIGVFAPAHLEDLFIRFSKDGTVRNYTYNTDFGGK